MTSRSEVLEFNILEKEYDICRSIGLAQETKLYHICRSRYADNTLIAIESTYLPYNLFPGWTINVLRERPLYDIMRSDYGIVPNSADESFGAALLGQEHAQLFGLSVGEPELDIVRKTFSDLTCIEYTHGVIRADKFRFHVKLKSDS